MEHVVKAVMLENENQLSLMIAVGNPRLEQMIRSLMMRHHQPDRPLLEAVAAGDTDTVKTLLAHLPSPPSVCHIHVSFLA